ncbi:MAG: peptidoglycan bridge formation protein FemAB, partial [Candidatus Thorarchaeota archaeon]
KTYKHKPVYLVAKEGGEIRGILPMFLMRSVIFGKKLVSVPSAPYGGVC